MYRKSLTGSLVRSWGPSRFWLLSIAVDISRSVAGFRNWSPGLEIGRWVSRMVPAVEGLAFPQPRALL